MERFTIAVNVSGEGGNPTFEVEGHFLAVPLVNQLDADAAGNKSHFPETLDKCFETEAGFILEDFTIKMKRYRSASVIASVCANGFDGFLGDSFFVPLEVNFIRAVNGDFAPFRQRIYRRNTHTVQTTRDFVGSPAKFATSMQYGHNNLQS